MTCKRKRALTDRTCCCNGTISQRHFGYWACLWLWMLYDHVVCCWRWWTLMKEKSSLFVNLCLVDHRQGHRTPFVHVHYVHATSVKHFNIISCTRWMSVFFFHHVACSRFAVANVFVISKYACALYVSWTAAVWTKHSSWCGRSDGRCLCWVRQESRQQLLLRAVNAC